MQKIGGYMPYEYIGKPAGYFCKELTGLGNKIISALKDENDDSFRKVIHIIGYLNRVTNKIGIIERAIKRHHMPQGDLERGALERICFILNIFKSSSYGVNRSSTKNYPNEKNIHLGLFGSHLYFGPIEKFRYQEIIPEPIVKELALYEELFLELANLINDVGSD